MPDSPVSPAINLRCIRRLEFDAAHRIRGHENKCRFLHGHRYAVEAEFMMLKQEEGGVDTLGRVIDFGEVRALLGAWIDEHWDHNAILWEQDRELGEAVAAQTHQRIYYLPLNPTAENIAAYLLERVCPLIFAGMPVRCTRITVYETPNCRAEAGFSA